MKYEIKPVLMRRDNMSEAEAEEMIADAANDLDRRLGKGEMPFDICQEWFGLEPDYLDDLMSRLM